MCHSLLQPCTPRPPAGNQLRSSVLPFLLLFVKISTFLYMFFNFPFFFTQKIYHLCFFYTLLSLCVQYYLLEDTPYQFIEVLPHSFFIATQYSTRHHSCPHCPPGDRQGGVLQLTIPNNAAGLMHMGFRCLGVYPQGKCLGVRFLGSRVKVT